jgi:phosphoserine phosphatase RsbU/P
MSSSKILIVEDHPMSRKMLEAMLRRQYEVESASSGQEAVDLAREHGPDLVLLDIEMPGMDGFQTLEILKAEVIDPAVPVIFLTAREDAESRERGLEAGAVDYLIKPYDRQELTIKVKNHLALYEARKEIEERNRIMAREMEMASQLQSSILPQQLPVTEDLYFSVIYLPVSPAGGDFYDFIELPDGLVGFAQVDVSGHGVASAMIGAMFKMAFQSFARETQSPARLLATINEEMFRVLPDSDYLTVFYGIVDPQNATLVYTNAGHPRPFLYRAETGLVDELGVGGALVGAFPDQEYEEERVSFSRNDALLIFTDGVTEAAPKGSADEFFGEDRLKSLFRDFVQTSHEDVLSRIMADLESFRKGRHFEDDITMLLVSVLR